MKLNRLLLFIGLVAFISFKALSVTDENLVPKIYSPPGIVISALSDNGNYAVEAQYNAADPGSVFYIRASYIDMTTEPYTIRDISDGSKMTGALDITDDGKLVVGMSYGKPAYWTEETGWVILPVPGGFDAGEVNSCTPDGKYAVGLIRDKNNIWIEDACMWDLTTGQVVEIPNLPVTDRSGGYQNQNRFTQISADGRYVLGVLSFSYYADEIVYAYDRVTDEPIYVSHTKRGNTWTPRIPNVGLCDVDAVAKSMSTDGHYISGKADVGLYDETAFIFDVWNEELKILDQPEHMDSWSYAVSDDGLLFVSKPIYGTLGDGHVYYDGILYSFEEIYRDAYGIDIRDYGFETTCKPVFVSKDGRTIGFVNIIGQSYILKLKEDLQDACKRVDLFGNKNITPADGSTMAGLSKIEIRFERNIENHNLTSENVSLQDKDGNVIAKPLAQSGIVVTDNLLTISFRSIKFEEGKEYFLTIPAGSLNIKGRSDLLNDEIRLSYKGRVEGPVQVEKITPPAGSALETIYYPYGQIIIRYKSEIKIDPSKGVYITIDDEDEPIGKLNVSLNDNSSLALFPSTPTNLYKGSHYYIHLPEGLVTDVSGLGASEELVIEYTGNYTNVTEEGNILFKSDCNDLNDFMLYDGDKGTPVAEYAELGFTNDTPWVLVRDDYDSRDNMVASHSSYTDGRASNDWLGIRQLSIPDDNVFLSFDSRAYRRTKEDRLKVYVYATDKTINMLTGNIVGEVVENADLVFDQILNSSDSANSGSLWKHNVIPLKDYAGKNVYIFFVNDNQNQSMVILDNILVAKDVAGFINVTTPSIVVDKDSQKIRGRLSISSELSEYKGLKMELFDADGKSVSVITENDKNFSFGDSYSFEFPEPLPLTVGEENAFSIEAKMAEEVMAFSSKILDLKFEPTKKIVLEEFTGEACQYCPLGIATIDRMEKMYGNQFIPIALHCFTPSSPKAAGVLDYSSFLGMDAAPTARINRGSVTNPLVYSSELGRYVATGIEYGNSNVKLWQDEVENELSVLTPLQIDLRINDVETNNLNCTAVIRSAVNMNDFNINLFCVLLEDGLSGVQTNGVSNNEDPLLGEWGKGGIYGQSTVWNYTYNDVARATWGESFKGTPNLFPTEFKIGKDYSYEFNFEIPPYVENVDNCKVAAMIIDRKTGKILNACCSEKVSGVNKITETDGNLSARLENDKLIVNSEEAAHVSVYSVNGLKIIDVEGTGEITLPLNGYKGLIIVNVNTPNKSISRKFMAN